REGAAATRTRRAPACSPYRRAVARKPRGGHIPTAGPDVHRVVTDHEEAERADEAVARLLDVARSAALATAAPSASAPLRALFALGGPLVAAETVSLDSGRQAAFKRRLSSLAAKAAAALLGGSLLVGGLGVAGALPGVGAPTWRHDAPAVTPDAVPNVAG